MATIADVARYAGVATSTVSHVLNGTRYVSVETTRAVQDAVKAVGYTPNTLARALARSTTNTIGLAVSSTANRYFADVINAVEEECHKLGMMVLLGNTHDEPEREFKVVAELHQRRVDGIIFAPSCDPASRALDYIKEKAIPVVMLDRLPPVGLDGVGVENYDSIAAIVHHLVWHGHRRIGFLGGQAGFTTAQERGIAFRDALRRYGCPVDEALISIGYTDLASVREATDRMLGLDEPVTAFVGGNNLTTIGIIGAIRARGLRVPDDVAVIGFDDFEWADAFEPRLTLMEQPCREIGRTAAELVQARIAAVKAPRSVVRLRPHLVVRESCGCGRNGLRPPSGPLQDQRLTS